jgi:hypothetical protein
MVNLAPSIQVPGTVVSRNDARIAAEVAGRLTWIAEVGATSRRGEPVARIDDAELRLQRDEFRGVLAAQESRRGFLEREAERLRQLAAENNCREPPRRGRIRPAGGQRYRRGARPARPDRAAARAHAGRAPFDGVVTERLRTPGEHTAPGDEVVRLVDPANLEVVARAPLPSLGFVGPGTELQFHSQWHAGTGTIRTLVPFGDSRSHMFELRLSIPARRGGSAKTCACRCRRARPPRCWPCRATRWCCGARAPPCSASDENGTAEQIEVVPRRRRRTTWSP